MVQEQGKHPIYFEILCVRQQMYREPQFTTKCQWTNQTIQHTTSLQHQVTLYYYRYIRLVWYYERNKASRLQFHDVYKFEIRQLVFVIQVGSLKGQHSTFTGTVETDGVAINFHFQREKNTIQTNDHNITPADRIIGIDPGRSNIIFAVEKLEGIYNYKYNYKYWRLTRSQYYNESGITAARKHTMQWSKSINNELQVLSKASPKSASFSGFHLYIKAYMESKDALWKEYTNKHWLSKSLRQ